MKAYNPDLKVQGYQLKQRQALPLDCKVKLSLNRIKHWYDQWGGDCYVAFSGGKDSTVLLDLCRKYYPEMEAVFVDTGLEYPEIREFVKQTPNVTRLKPTLTFKDVLEKKGYPVISKSVAEALYKIKSPGTSERVRQKALYGDEKGSYGKLPKKYRYLIDAPFKISARCCEVMKMNPTIKYYKKTGKVPFVGTMASDSNKRAYAYMKKGCFMMNKSQPKCTPLGFWTTEDIWEYIKTNDLPYCSIYDTGVKHTGCVFCMFGAHLEQSPNRFERMKTTHPSLYSYCMNKLGLRDVLDFVGISY